MYYTVKSKHFVLKLTPEELADAQAMETEGLIQVTEDNKPVETKKGLMFKVEFTGESFDLDSIAPFLKKAVKKDTFLVHFEDHKGEDRYGVEFGPGFCEEE